MSFLGYFLIMVLMCLFVFKMNTSSESPVVNGLYVVFTLLIIYFFSFNVVMTKNIFRYLPVLILSGVVLYRTFPKFKIQMVSLYARFKNRKF